jgi:hypothetical protein
MHAFAVDTACAYSAEPCSNLSLLYTFYGIAIGFSGTNAFYAGFAYATLLVVTLFSSSGLTVLPASLHFLFGFVCGFSIARLLHTVVIAPKNVLRNRYQLILYFVELAAGLLIFAYIDERVPENGFPVGLWCSLLLYVLWFGSIYFINFKYGGFDSKNYGIRHEFTYTYIYWFSTMLPFFATSAIPLINRYVSGALATGVTLLLALIYRYNTQSRIVLL